MEEAGLRLRAGVVFSSGQGMAAGCCTGALRAIRRGKERPALRAPGSVATAWRCRGAAPEAAMAKAGGRDFAIAAVAGYDIDFCFVY